MLGATDIQLVISAKDEASKTLQKVKGEIGGLGKSGGVMMKLGTAAKYAGMAVAGLGAALGTAGAFAVKSASDFEQSRIAFEVMLGSADAAREMLKKISDFAVKTPFELPQVVEGAKRLLAYNIEAEKLLPTLSALGDIAAGVGKDKLPNLILAFGQVKAATRLTGMELRQFTEAGVPLLSLLAEEMGKTEAEIKDMTSEGEISFEAVEKAIMSTTQEGGKFFNLMERQSKTFSGIMSNIKDDLGRVAREMVGMTEEGDIIEGSIFYYLKMGAENLFAYITANKDTITNFVKGGIDAVVNFVAGWRELVSWIRSVFSETSIVGQAWIVIKDIFLMVKDEIVKSWNEIMLAIEPIKPELLLVAKILGGTLLVAIMVIVTAFLVLLATAVKVIEKIVKFFSNGIQSMKATWTIFKNYWQGAIEAMKGNWSGAMEHWKKALVAALNYGKKQVESFVNFFIKAMNKVIEGMNKVPGVDIGKVSEFKFKQFGGAVGAGQPYVVGEHRPEVFVPSQSGNIRQTSDVNKTFNVNFNNVTVRNEGDIDEIVRKVKYAINKEQEFYQLGAI